MIGSAVAARRWATSVWWRRARRIQGSPASAIRSVISSTHPSAATVLWDELDAGSASTAPGLDLLEKRWPGTNQGAEVRAGFLVGGVRAALGSAATKDSSTGRSGAMA